MKANQDLNLFLGLNSLWVCWSRTDDLTLFQCSHIHTGEMQTCCLIIFLVFLPKIDLCFLSAWSNWSSKPVPAPFSKEVFKQLEMEADFREAVGLQLPSLSLVLHGPYIVLHCYGIEGAGLRLPLVLGEQRRVFCGWWCLSMLWAWKTG